MTGSVLLTYEQLFFLGELMRAEYIDYRYIELMNDLQQRYKFLKNQATAELVEQGLIDEDFFGEVNIKPELKDLLEPIFFGKTESSADVTTIQDEAETTVHLFHILEDRITGVTLKDSKLEIKPVEKNQINDFVSSLCVDVPKDVSDCQYDAERISKIINLKNATVGVNGTSRLFVISNNALFCQGNDLNACYVSKEDFCNVAEKTLRGEL